MSKRKRILLILAVLATIVLAIVAIITAIRLQQIGTEPVAPSVPKSKPKAAAANQCHQSWTIVAAPTATPTAVPGELTCGSKVAYRNDPGNTPGVYTLTGSNSIASGGTVLPGDILVYIVSANNTKTTNLSVQTVDQLDPRLDFMDANASTNCSFTASTRMVACTSTLVAGSTGRTTASFRVKVKDNAAEGVLDNVATTSASGATADTCKNTLTIGSNDLTCHFDTYQGKRVYRNDASNTPGVYTLTTGNRLNNGASVNPGDIIVYSVIIKNTGTTTISEGGLVDTVDPRLDFMDATSSCVFNASTRKVTCGPIAITAGAVATQSFRVKIQNGAAGGALNNTATLSVGSVTVDTCLANLVLPGPTATPTLQPTATPTPGGPTATPTPTGGPTATPTPRPTNTPVPGTIGQPTNTPVPLATNTPTPGVTLACTDLDLPGGTSRKQNESISFVCKGDPSAQVTQCRFRFGDGSAEVFEDDCNVIKQYSSLGNYATSCEVRDTSGNWRAASACEATVQIASGPTNTPAPGATAYPTNQQSTPKPSAVPTTVLAEGPTAIPTVPQQSLPTAGGIGQTIGIIVGGIGVILLGLLMLL